MDEEQPYCAAGQCYVKREWLKIPEVLAALGLSKAEAEKWRCKSAAVSGWKEWAKDKGFIIPKKSILHMGDLVIYKKSHIEVVTDDDSTDTGPFTALGFNTSAAGSRDGEGCFEKPRTRADVDCFIRIFKS